MEMVGMNVERMLCKNTYTTRITKSIASNNVFTTFLIDASKKSFELIRSTISTPFGSVGLMASTSLSINLMISLAFEPEVWAIIQLVPGKPFTSPIYL